MCGRYLKPIVLVFLLVVAESIVPAQVTDQDLLKPDPNDWLMYSGDSGHGNGSRLGAQRRSACNEFTKLGEDRPFGGGHDE